MPKEATSECEWFHSVHGKVVGILLATTPHFMRVGLTETILKSLNYREYEAGEMVYLRRDHMEFIKFVHKEEANVKAT